MVRWLAASVVACIALAGCMVPNLAPDIVPDDAPSFGGYGSQPWTVTVVDEEGEPVADAAVVAYWVGFVDGASTDIRAHQARGGLLRQGELHYVALRSDGAGKATFHAPAKYVVTVTAQAATTTEEFLVRNMPENGTQLTLTLYPKTVRASWNGSWTGGGCDLRRLEFPRHDEEYKQRLHDATFYLNWTNDVPEGVSDWEIGTAIPAPLAIFGPECPEPRQAAGAHMTLGPQSETLAVPRNASGLDNILDTGFYFGPVSRGLGPVGASVATPLHPYRIEVVANLGWTPEERANIGKEFPGWIARPALADGGDDPAGLFGEPTFESDRARPRVVPVPPAALALALLLGLAVVARRSSRFA